MLLLLAMSFFAPGRLATMLYWVTNSDIVSKLRTVSSSETSMDYALIEMVVETIGISRIDHQPAVILKEKVGNRYLPIWIGLIEANAISVILERVDVPRPLTPDLLCSIIDKMGARVHHVAINDLQNNIFYADIFVDAHWQRMEIDARPSDAIAIALRVGVPIYVKNEILNEVGIQSDDETGKYTTFLMENNGNGWSPDFIRLTMNKQNIR